MLFELFSTSYNKGEDDDDHYSSHKKRCMNIMWLVQDTWAYNYFIFNAPLNGIKTNNEIRSLI